ncbi:MAG: SapC family protein [Rubrivivax sp.]
MIVPNLHRQMVALDSNLHRELKLHQPALDWSIAGGMNALFVAGAEFGDVSREYPILFVRTGNDAQGKAQVAPIAALGLSPQENLFVDGTQWRALYLPVLLRAYPFAYAQVGTGQAGAPMRSVLCVDIGWGGLSRSEGVPLFDGEGRPGEHLQSVSTLLERFEAEVQRTRDLCRVLLDKDLLRDMRFDAELTDGRKLQVDGFLTVDEKQLAALPDAELLAMHRNGMMGLIYAHFISMGNLRKLVQWRVQRQALAQGGVAPS